MKLYPEPTAGFQPGTAKAIFTSENPQDQRKDSIRLDYRLNNNNQFMFRFQRSNWVAIDAFRGTFPFARTKWERPNRTETFNWTSTIRSNLINEFTYTHSLDEVFINVFTESGLHKRSRTGSTIRTSSRLARRSRTRSRRSTSTTSADSTAVRTRRPRRGRFTRSRTPRPGEGSAHVQGGRGLRVSGEDDFDQINVSAIPGGTNNQNGQFAFRNSATARSGNAMADMALGLFTDYAELGQRAFTKWRSLATDIFIQDSWKPRPI